MTHTELSKLHKSIAVDFKLATRKTDLWDIPRCYQILHDIKKLMQFGYLESVSLVLTDTSNAPLKAKKYLIVYTERMENHRPGNVDWEDGDGHNLDAVLTYTVSYHQLSPDQKATFQRDNLKSTWYSSNTNVDFPHLSPGRSKVYTQGNAGIDRVDFN